MRYARDLGRHQRSEIETKLGEITKGLGVRRADLYEKLGAQLRRLWGIESESDPVFEMVEWHLEWLIAQIQARESTPALKRAGEVEYFQRLARVTFNISISETADIPGVLARREWFKASGGQSPKESQMDMAEVVIPQIAAILERPGALPSRDFVLAELKRQKQPEEAPPATAAIPTPPRPRRPHPPLNDPLQRTLTALATSLRTRYIQEERQWQLNEPSPLLPLRWTNASDELTDHWQNIRGDGQAAPLDLSCSGSGSELLDTFHAAPSGRLVVLGEAGAGKSMLAVRFALALLDPEYQQAGEPVPVICKLVGWNVATTGFHDWLIGQLAPLLPTKGRVDERRIQAAELLASGRLLPILDGFDEIGGEVRPLAILEINSGLNRGERALLLSRPAAYVEAVQTGIDGPRKVLPGAAVVQLQPLTLGGVMAYLEATAAKSVVDGKPVTKWQPVFEVLRTEPGRADAQALAHILSTPLMVSMARQVYNETDADPEDLLHTDPADIAEQLLGGFVDVACFRFEESADGREVPRRWPPQKARAYLEQLALRLQQDWSPTFEWWGFGNSTRLAYRLAPLPWLVGWVGFVLLLGSSWSLLSGLANSLAWFALWFVLTPMQQYTEFAKGWCVPGTTRCLVGFSLANRRASRLGFAFAFVILLGLVASNLRQPYVIAPLAGIVLAMQGLEYDEITTSMFVQAGSSPSVFLRSRRRLVLGYSGFALAGGLLACAALYVLLGVSLATSIRALLLLVDAVLVAAFSTTWGRWVLVRVWLAMTGCLPWSLMAFLKDMHRRGLLRQDGPAYAFRHAQLLDYLTAEALRHLPPRRAYRRRMLDVRNNLAVSWGEAGRADDAVQELRAALAVARRKYGDGAYITALLWTNVVDFDYAEGRHFDTEAALAEVQYVLLATDLELRREHARTLRCWTRFIHLLRSSNRVAEAHSELAELRQALARQPEPARERDLSYATSLLENSGSLDDEARAIWWPN